ncbi:bifunctional FO biosynthesis protein CofGH [Saccharopolyspora mangrovi]|uniref:FO synthase n=1 Tax=Saccharopolyspora mangrovi TaxID=3082379 RepID=A0ABU6ACE2_9PSEU|nr:bifunctional FO biosynthesis protein CofGH [Saccharopolyspora sp. S2-29]MEB3369000.1 bifunctional FO biosynthesis protein CofGH [Saccharopolyspora sp. S2-29]
MTTSPSSPEPTPSAIRRALRRASDGANLDVAEAAVLLHARGDDLQRLLDVAGRVRDQHLADQGRAGIVTYSRKVFIPLTRLCRDRCHYCTFATVPGKLDSYYLERDEVLSIARAGAAAGCKEALFTLGDRPESRWPQAQQWLAERGYDSTVDYVRACAIAVLEQTGLLPHLNPGVLSWEEIQRLKPVAPSMGMMLETTAERLWSDKTGPHYASPDKEPAVRLRVLDDAGRVGVPFTTGVLIGIGETRWERAESLHAIRQRARQYRNVQEIIVQNFRAKPDTAMRASPDASIEDLAATTAVARLLMPPGVSVQAPPNLIGDQHALLLKAGIDDWGGVSPVTADHVNPERPWPQIDALAEWTGAAGYRLRERLTAYPRYVRDADRWLDPRIHPHVAALAGHDGLAENGAAAAGLPWQEPDGGLETAGRADLHNAIDDEGRLSSRRSDFDSVYGDWDVLHDQASHTTQPSQGGRPAPERIAPEAREGLRIASADPAALLHESNATSAMALLTAEGVALDALTRLADELRASVVGNDVTYVVNRNINFSNVCYVGCRFCAFAQRERDADAYRLSTEEVTARAVEAAESGATEVCIQGGIDPKLPVDYYAGLVRAIKDAVPQMHVHAFSPMEIVSAASKAGVSVEEWLTELRDAGLGSIPGTAAEILDDEVRWVLTKGKLPAQTWIDVVSTAHRLGIPSSSTMMYGHVDHPGHWLSHLRVLARIAADTGGFTEFVGLPFVHHSAPIYLAGIARPGPTMRDNLAVHAFARLALHGRIDNVQCSWVKLGDEGTARVLRGGANDVGGSLMEETISRMAGSEHGSSRTPAELGALAARVGRPARQRTTTYGRLPAPLSGSHRS